MWNRPGAMPPAEAPVTQQGVPPLPDTAPAEATTVGRRTIAEITALVENIQYALSQGYEMPEFHEGVRDAYRWVLGQSAASYTGRMGIPDGAQLRAEDDAADEALRTGPRRKHANGVQHAVMWVRGLTDDQPWFWHG